MKYLAFSFQVVRRDANVWVRCPVCPLLRKREGILKHIVNEAASSADPELAALHADWLEQVGWTKGMRITVHNEPLGIDAKAIDEHEKHKLVPLA